MEYQELVRLAKEAMMGAYAPYSGYYVGAALLAKNGRVYTGCNIENAAYSPSCCAERTAFFKAVSQGEREFSAIAVVGGKAGKIQGFFPPCGVCRQVMLEFCRPDFTVVLADAEENIQCRTLQELVPLAFTSGEHLSDAAKAVDIR